MSTMAVIGGMSAIMAVPILLVTVVSWARHLRVGEGPTVKSREWPIVAALLLLMFPAVALLLRVQEGDNAWFAGVTTGAVAGLAVIAVGRILLLFDAAEQKAAVAIGAVGFIPVAVWLLSLAIIGIRDHDIPVLLGLLSVAVLVLAVCGIAAATIRDRSAARCFGGVLMIVMAGWLSVMAVDLFRSA